MSNRSQFEIMKKSFTKEELTADDKATLNSVGIKSINDLNDLLLSSSQGLGYLRGYDYKGFKFFIKEENNPNFVVKGNKRRYATAVNKDGNDVLQSSSSFTLEPDVLVEELKLQIDQKGLVA